MREPRTLKQIVQHNLREAILNSGLSKADLYAATRHAVSVRTLTSIRSSRPKRHGIALDHIEALARALKVEPWLLLLPDFDAMNAPTAEEVKLTSLAIRRIGAQGAMREAEKPIGAPKPSSAAGSSHHRTGPPSRRSAAVETDTVTSERNRSRGS